MQTLNFGQEFFQDQCLPEKLDQRKQDLKRARKSKAIQTNSLFQQIWQQCGPGSSLAICNRCVQVFSFVDLPGAKPKVNETKACWDLGLSKERILNTESMRSICIRFPLTVTWIDRSVDHPGIQVQRPTNYAFLKSYLSTFVGDLPTRYEMEASD